MSGLVGMLHMQQEYVVDHSSSDTTVIMAVVFIIVFIQKRPQGMFALKGRAAEV